MRKLSGIALVGAAALALALSSAPMASAQDNAGGGSAPSASSSGGSSGGGATTKVGYLSCNVASGWGIIFGSSRALDCTYTPVSGKEPEKYKGSITKFGADIGYLQSGVILWTVVAPSTNTGPGALAGHYAGATASAAAGVGAGANVLVGGMHSSIALQPISIEGQAGLNVAAGIATIDLHYVFPPRKS